MGYANFIGLHSSADQAFTVDPRLWQAALFKASVLSRPSWYDHDPSVSVGGAMASLRHQGLVAPMFTEEIDPEVLQRLRGLRPQLRTPVELIQGYLQHLSKVGLVECEEGRWRPSESSRTLIDAKQEQLKAIRERRDWLVGQVESLLRKSSIEPDAFDLTAWLRDPLGDMLAPAETIKEGGRPWEALKRAVADLEMSFQNDGALPDCLGLPIAEAIAEAAEARRVAVLLEQQQAEARELAAAEARGVRFRAEAMNRLGPEAESWLGARRKTDGVTRFSAAQASDTVFAQLIAALEKAAAERADRISRKQRAEAARRALKERASEVLGEGHAAVFVGSTHPAIGMHPNDYCVDELTLAECVRLLKLAKPRRR